MKGGTVYIAICKDNHGSILESFVYSDLDKANEKLKKMYDYDLSMIGEYDKNKTDFYDEFHEGRLTVNDDFWYDYSIMNSTLIM